MPHGRTWGRFILVANWRETGGAAIRRQSAARSHALQYAGLVDAKVAGAGGGNATWSQRRCADHKVGGRSYRIGAGRELISTLAAGTELTVNQILRYQTVNRSEERRVGKEC